jgi:hypothetical protein
MRQVSKSFPSDYKIYVSVSKPESYYAIQDSEAERIEQIREKYKSTNQPIPDSFTAKVLKFGIIEGKSEYGIIDQNPTERKINDLTEKLLWGVSEGSL